MITILEVIEEFYFSKNPIIHKFNSSESVTDEQLSTLSFRVGAGYADNKSISFYNGSGINETWVFQDIPTLDNPNYRYIQRFESSGLSDIGYYNKHIIPIIIKSRILEQYNLTSTSLPGDIIQLIFTAKNGDEKYDFETNTDSTMPIGGFRYEVRTSPVVHIEANVYIHHHEGSRIFRHTFAGNIKAFPQKNGDLFLDLSECVNSFLSPKLYLSSGMSGKTNLSFFENVLEAHVLIKEVNSNTSIILSEFNYSFLAILGGFSPLTTLEEKQPYYMVSEESMPKLLTVTKSETRIPPKFLSLYTYIVSERENIGLFGKFIRFYKVFDGEITVSREDYLGDSSDTLENLIPVFSELIFLEDEVSVAIFPSDENIEPREELGIILNVDRTPYLFNNYFLFYNSLGGQDLAWFTGSVSINTGAELEDVYITTQESDNLNQHPNSERIGANAVTIITINTGLKTKNEIEWMKEIIQSPKIIWFNQENLNLFVDNFYDYETLQLVKFLYIKPVTKEVEIKPSENQMFSFDFEFEIATDSPANIHYL